MPRCFSFCTASCIHSSPEKPGPPWGLDINPVALKKLMDVDGILPTTVILMMISMAFLEWDNGNVRSSSMGSQQTSIGPTTQFTIRCPQTWPPHEFGDDPFFRMLPKNPLREGLWTSKKLKSLRTLFGALCVCPEPGGKTPLYSLVPFAH